jgi:polyisoprenoid-binding protein YceI
VAAASIDTSNKRRDAHLRSADFFDADNYRDITFRVDGISPSGEGVKVAGSLTVGTTARKMTFDAKVSVPDGNEVWLDAGLQVNRADFGLTWNQMGMASMENAITIHAVFVR